MFWTVDLENTRYTSEDSARAAAQSIADAEFRPVIVCMGLPEVEYTEFAFDVRASRAIR